MEEMHGAGVWEGARGLHTLYGCTTLPAPPRVHLPGTSPTVSV